MGNQSQRNIFLSWPTATMPCSLVMSMVLMPTSRPRVWAQVLDLKSQNLMLPSLEQLMMIYLDSCSSLVMWDECSTGRLRIRLPVLMSHIFIILSSPPLNIVQSSCNSNMLQMKSVCPVRVFRHAELYFLVRLHTLIVRSELPEMRVCPLLVHSMHRMSLMWPEKFFMFSPFSQSHILMLQSALPEAKVPPSFRYRKEITDDVWPVRVFSGLRGGTALLFFDSWLIWETCRLLWDKSASLSGSGHILIVLSQDPVTSLALGRVIMHLTPPTWHWYDPMFSKVVMSNMFNDPSSEPVIILRSGNLHATQTVLLWLEGNDADFAYFFTPETGTEDSWSSRALGFRSLVVGARLDVLCSVINSGPACDSLFSNTLKQDLMLSKRVQSISGVSSCMDIRFSYNF